MRLTAIMSEAAVRQQMDGPALLRKQLHRLTRTVREYDVTVQLVPFTADAHAALCDQFEIIQWPLDTAAGRVHLTPSALIRQWVTEHVEATDEENDFATAIATLHHDVEWVAAPIKPA